MNATFTVRHNVADFATWRAAYDSAETIRNQHGCTAHKVYRAPNDTNDIFVTHDFPSVEQAAAFAADPALAAAMQNGGVQSAPRIEIFESV